MKPKQRISVTEGRTTGHPKIPTPQPTSVGTKEGTSGRPYELPKERATERHPYDFYKDQILWLNRTKVEIQEKYGRRVTANAIVQLALDLLIRDYRRRGERSSLMTNLVLNPLTAMGLANQGSEEALSEATSERTSGES